MMQVGDTHDYYDLPMKTFMIMHLYIITLHLIFALVPLIFFEEEVRNTGSALFSANNYYCDCRENDRWLDTMNGRTRL